MMLTNGYLQTMTDATLAYAFEEAVRFSTNKLENAPRHGVVRSIVDKIKLDLGGEITNGEVRAARLAIMTEIAVRWTAQNTAGSADERTAAKEAGRTGQLPATGDGGTLSGERRSGKDAAHSSAPILQAEHSGSIPETSPIAQATTQTSRTVSVLEQQPSHVGTQPDPAVSFIPDDALEKIARGAVLSLYFLSADLTKPMLCTEVDRLSSVVSKQPEFTRPVKAYVVSLNKEQGVKHGES